VCVYVCVCVYMPFCYAQCSWCIFIVSGVENVHTTMLVECVEITALACTYRLISES